MTDPTSLLTDGPLFQADAQIAARLQAAFPPAKVQYGVVPARLTAEAWRQLTRRTPFAGLGFEGIAPRRGVGRAFGGAARFHVFLVAANAVVPNLWRGDALAAGLYGMAQLAVFVLHGWDVAGVGYCEVASVQQVSADDWAPEGMGIVQVTLDVQIALDDQALLEALPDFLRLGADWALPDLPPEVFDVRTTP